MEPADTHKMAVATPFGLFEFLKMSFGLHNAAQTFQHFINQVLRGLLFTDAYIDDLHITRDILALYQPSSLWPPFHLRLHRRSPQRQLKS